MLLKIRILLLATLSIALFTGCKWQGIAPPDVPCLVLSGGEVARPAPHQVKWSTSEFGVVFHYDLHVFDGQRYSQDGNRLNALDNIDVFNPTLYDTDQWIKAVADAGAKFAILTAMHETGFGLWQSDVNPFSLKATKWRDGKGDVMADFVASCRKYGVSPGVYVGLRWNSHLGVYNFEVQPNSPLTQTQYKQWCEKVVEELCSRYGELFMIWFDGGADDPKGYGADVEPIVNRLQPNCLFYHNNDRADLRWGGSETGTVGYPCWSSFPYPFSHNKQTDNATHSRLLVYGDSIGRYWVPAMADAPLRGSNGRHEWFWEPDDDANVDSLDKLMNMYQRSVGRNATLVLGVTPDPRGLIPDVDVQRLAEFGKAVDNKYGHPIASASGKGQFCMLPLGAKKSIDCCVTGEDITFGQLVREYEIYARVDGKWKKVSQGTSIGNKRIDCFDAVTTDCVCLVVRKAVAEPQIGRFEAFVAE